MNEVNISPCAKSVTIRLAELKRHELRRNMNEVNISPCAKSVTIRLAELRRHELRRITTKTYFQVPQARSDLTDCLTVYKWKQLNRCSV